MPSATGFSIRGLLASSFSDIASDLKIAAEVDSLVLSKRLVLEGHGSAFFPWSVVAEEVDSGDIVLRRLARGKLERDLTIYSAQQQPASKQASLRAQ